MRKLLLSLLISCPLLGLSVYAAPLTIFGRTLSFLDYMLLIGLGLILIGVLFLCIAFFKKSTKKDIPIESPFDVYMEDSKNDASYEESGFEEDNEEDSSPENQEEELEILDAPDISEENTEESESVLDAEATIEEQVDSLEESEVEPESVIIDEPIPETTVVDEPELISEEELAEPDPVAEPEPVEEKIYPKLILTNTVTNDFVILPLYAETTVGRKTDNDLVLSDVTISGLHCKVLNEDGVIYIQDENSTNGTFVNGQRISEKAELHKGDKILLGKREFSVSINE